MDIHSLDIALLKYSTKTKHNIIATQVKTMKNQTLNFMAHQLQKVSLPLNKKQFDRFLDWYNNSIYIHLLKKNMPTYEGHYHFTKFNCAHFVKYSLRAMGYDIHRSFYMFPLTPSQVLERCQRLKRKIDNKIFKLNLNTIGIHYIKKQVLPWQYFEELMQGKKI